MKYAQLNNNIIIIVMIIIIIMITIDLVYKWRKTEKDKAPESSKAEGRQPE